MLKKAKTYVTFDGRLVRPGENYEVTDFDSTKLNRDVQRSEVAEAAKEKAKEIVKEEEKRKKEESGGDMKSWLPWATAGGAGLIGHSLVSSLFDGDPDSDRKNKSIWYRLLATLAPIAAGGASAYGGYLLGKNLNGEKTAQAKPAVPVAPGAQAAPAAKVAPQPKAPPVPVFDLDKAMEDYEGFPMTRAMATGLSGLATYGGARFGLDQFLKWKDAPQTIQPDQSVIDSANNNIQDLQRRLQASEAELRRRAGVNRDLGDVAREAAQEAVDAARTSGGRNARGAAVERARALDEIAKANAEGSAPVEDAATLRAQIQAEQARKAPVANPNKRIYGRRAGYGAGIGLAGLVGLGIGGNSIVDYYKTQRKLDKIQQNVELQRALMDQRK